MSESAGMDNKDPHPTFPWIHCLILGLVGLAVGLYLIGTTVLISEDGTVYIAQAKQFSASVKQAIHRQYFGYPLLIFLWHSIFYPSSGDALSWAHAAQSINLTCRIGGCLLLYGMARR